MALIQENLPPEPFQVFADRISTPAGGTPTIEQVGDVAFSGLRFSQVLSGFGDGEIVIPLDVSRVDRATLTRLWGVRYWVLYGGRAVWCGVPHKVVDDARATVRLSLIEVHGYLTRRVTDFRAPYASGVFNQVEQTEIGRQIAYPVRDMGLTISVSPGSGFPRDRTYERLEGPYCADLLKNLSNVIQGPEFRAEYSGPNTGGDSAASLRIAYPQVGNATSELAVSLPGNALSASLEVDGAMLRSWTYAVGDVPEGMPLDTPKPVALRTRNFLDGRPRLDYVDDWPGTILQSTLIERADTMSAKHETAEQIVDASGFVNLPPLYSYGVGDAVTVLIVDPLWPAGNAFTARLAGREVNAASGQVKWALRVGQPITRPAPGIVERLGSVSHFSGQLFRNRVQP